MKSDLSSASVVSIFQTNNYFRYIEGWHVKFTRWSNNEPRTDGNCVYVDVDGKWKTGNCNESISSVCMKSTGKFKKLSSS